MTLVERDGETAALRDAIRQARAGAGSTIVISGPPGIGKSALLQDAVQDVQASGMHALRARGGELEQEFPYGVIRQLFEATLRYADATARSQLLAGPAQPAGALLGGELAAAAADAAALEHAFYWLTVNLAETQPLAILVDDAHWADLPSIRSLVYLARRLRELPVALVVAMRPPDDTRRALAGRLVGEAARTLEPAALSADGVRTLLDADLAGADGEFTQACHAASGGNPFLVTELIGAVQAAGLQPVASNAARVRTVGAESVMQSVVLRLAGLSTEATPIARALAILGESTRHDLVAQLAQVDEAATVSAIDELRGAHILAPDDPPRFVHSIVHGAVYGDIGAGQRSMLHATAAQLLAERGAQPDAVAAHLLHTLPGSDPWTFQQLLGAASSGLATTAPDTIAAYLERALHENVPGVDRVPLLLGLGAARFQSVAGGAVPPLTEALGATTDPGMRLEIVRALCSAHMTERRYDECWALVDATIAEFHDHPAFADDLQIFAANALYSDAYSGPDLLARVRAWQPDPAATKPRDRTKFAIQSWAVMSAPSPADAYASLADRALSTGTLVDDDTWYITFEMAMWSLIAAGRHADALAHLDSAISSRRAMGRLLRAASLMLLRAEVFRRIGSLQFALEDARLAVDVIPAEQIYAPQSATSLVLALLDRGDPDAARETLAQHGLLESIPDGGVMDIAWFARGRLRIASGDLAGGIDDLLHYGAISERLERHNPGYWPWRSASATALVQAGRRDEALELARVECELADIVGLPELQGQARTALGLAQQGDEGIATLEAAVDSLDGTPLMPALAAAQLALGRALRISGKRERAREPLLAALDAATRMGAQPLADAAREELRAAGARPRRAVTSGLDALTPSERRVASLAAEGLTNREIAHTLYVTPKTIEAHLAAAYRKLGVSGKAALKGMFGPEPAGELA